MIVTSIGAIPLGEGRTFAVGGQRIAIFRARTGQVFATDGECPHKAGPLADGLLGGTTLICPLHAWKWDLATGQAIQGDCALRVYPTSVDEGGTISVDMG